MKAVVYGSSEGAVGVQEVKYKRTYIVAFLMRKFSLT